MSPPIVSRRAGNLARTHSRRDNGRGLRTGLHQCPIERGRVVCSARAPGIHRTPGKSVGRQPGQVSWLSTSLCILTGDEHSQHILGSISPASTSTTRVLRMTVFISTRFLGSVRTAPMSTASSP